MEWSSAPEKPHDERAGKHSGSRPQTAQHSSAVYCQILLQSSEWLEHSKPDIINLVNTAHLRSQTNSQLMLWRELQQHKYEADW